MIYPVTAPLYVMQTKVKKFHLNLNIYRNSHFQVLNKTKIAYKHAIAEQIILLPKMDKVRISYTLYPKTKRLCDLDNVLSIHAKYTQDALVEYGVIPEDTYKHIPSISFNFGCVDKHSPRVMIHIEEIK